jgi:nicotinamidase/pyrazinamidase
MKALLIIDLQNDFLPGGALPAPEGNKIIPVINRIMDQFDLVIASRDWHPDNTTHFERWPPHCIRGTEGAAPPDSFQTVELKKIFLKGTENKDDGYSAFDATNENLDDYLKQHNISRLFVAGLTIEYCIRATVLDALKYGYHTYVIKDASAGVEAGKNDVDLAIKEMQRAGAHIINSTQIN